MTSQEAVERLEAMSAQQLAALAKTLAFAAELKAAIEELKAMKAAPVAAPVTGAVFPFGTSKGKPVAGADMRSLEFFRGACLKTLADPDKQRFHEKERVLLTAIDAEMQRQGVTPPPVSSFDPPPPSDADAPPDDTDAPF
jgi:hypothetical protein